MRAVGSKRNVTLSAVHAGLHMTLATCLPLDDGGWCRYIIALADVQHVPERAYVWATQDGGGAWVEELVLHLQHVKCPP